MLGWEYLHTLRLEVSR